MGKDDLKDTILCLIIGTLIAIAFILTTLGDGSYGLINLLAL